MGLRDLPIKATQITRKRLGLPNPWVTMDPFALSREERARSSALASGEFAKIFFAHKGRTVHKWIHYLDIYERHFAAFRNTPLRMLEIGVAMGGSLELWREYFGPDARIFGIDKDQSCATRVTSPNQVRIGSQADPRFLRSVVDELGPPDIVLDDGSHIGRHQRISFETLFPLLKEGGLYVIEDLHTSYLLGQYEGGYRRKGTAIEFMKQLVDDMHAWYHRRRTKSPARDWIRAIHFYDSIVVIEKQRIDRPSHVMIA